jgi:BirA family transcriptional regulator, biotin operon repressor / biotin---[acetyl-CoA-carboxylase] ligase
MRGDDSCGHSISKFAMLKNTNLLPHPGKENQHRTRFDNPLIELESVDSTNNYAMARIHEGMASDGLICLAHHQEAGKGQRGKNWLSEPGQNLMMSLIIEPSPLILSQQFLFSAAVALGILDQVTRQIPHGWTVKWPNDIYWNDRKAAGILIESVIHGNNWSFAVVGIGMNLNQQIFPPELPNPVSLRQITGLQYNAVQIAYDFKYAIQKRIAVLKQDPDQILTQYNLALYGKGTPIMVKKGNDSLFTRLFGVDATGLLITENGSFKWGEIELTFGGR